VAQVLADRQSKGVELECRSDAAGRLQSTELRLLLQLPDVPRQQTGSSDNYTSNFLVCENNNSSQNHHLQTNNHHQKAEEEKEEEEEPT
jgi:hypothetical protein